jgi:hypothetical protein
MAAMTEMHVKTGTTQEELLLEQVSWRSMGSNGSANRTVRDGYKASVSCVIGLESGGSSGAGT